MSRHGLHSICLLCLFLPVTGYMQTIQSASECQSCHEILHSQWQSSRHAFSSSEKNPFFAGMLEWANQTSQGANCLRCHEPVRYLGLETEIVTCFVDEGVTCDLCHVSTLDNESNWFVIQKGNVKYGPYSDAVSSVHKCRKLKLFETSRICLSCHGSSGSVSGMAFCSTESEWKQSSFAKSGVNCQDCHMPGVEGKAAPLGKIRDSIHSHVFYGGHSAEMLNNCAEIQVGSRRFENGFQLDIGVSIRRIGHALPTGSPMRMVYLLVEVMNEQGLILWRNMENSPFEDERALFMRLLQDDRGNAPVPPWEAVSEKFDRRLMPDETRSLEYMIEDTTAYSVQASLYYRLAPVMLLDRLGIQDSHYYERKLITSKTARLD